MTFEVETGKKFISEFRKMLPEVIPLENMSEFNLYFSAFDTDGLPFEIELVQNVKGGQLVNLYRGGSRLASYTDN